MNYILIIPKLTEMKQEIVIRDKEGIVVFVALKTQKHFHTYVKVCPKYSFLCREVRDISVYVCRNNILQYSTIYEMSYKVEKYALYVTIHIHTYKI